MLVRASAAVLVLALAVLIVAKYGLRLHERIPGWPSVLRAHGVDYSEKGTTSWLWNCGEVEIHIAGCSA